MGNKPSSVTRDKTTAVQVRQNAHCEVGEYPQCGRAKRPLWGGATGSKRALCSRGPKNPTVTRIETSAVKWGKTPSVRWRKTPIMRRRETPVVRRAKKVNPKITKISLALQHVTSNAFLGFCFFFLRMLLCVKAWRDLKKPRLKFCDYIFTSRFWVALKVRLSISVPTLIADSQYLRPVNTHFHLLNTVCVCLWRFLKIKYMFFFWGEHFIPDQCAVCFTKF